MGLSGTFDTMPFPDLMQWLGETGQRGMLTVTLEFEERYLHIEDGALCGFGSDDPRSRDLARVLRIPIEEIKKYISPKPLRHPDPPKPQPGENGPVG